jgi:hypothetical protein
MLFRVAVKEGATIFTDELQNLYVLEGDNVRKFLPDGSLQYEVSPKAFGEVSWADFTDPLRPLLFYRDLGKLMVLDNTLSEQGQALDLFNNGTIQPWMVCTSGDNHYWIYDLSNFELLRIDRAGRVISRSGNLVQICGKVPVPVSMMERNSELYLLDEEYGLFMFDVFATFIRVEPRAASGSFMSISSDFISVQFDHEVCFFNRPVNGITSPECRSLPEGARQLVFSKNRYYILLATRVEVYVYGQR